MSRDINRFNGKYLKCVVTPNITSTDVLKNSGSIIVYHPSLPFSTNQVSSESYLYGTNSEDTTSNFIMSSLQNFVKKFKEKNTTYADYVIKDEIGNFEKYAFSENNVIYDKLISQFDTNKNDTNYFSTFNIYPWSIDKRNINDQIYSYPKLLELEYRNDKNDINYLFLGNEFIASGYGFRTIEERDKISWLSDNFKSIFKSLYELSYYNYQLIDDTYNTAIPLFNKYVKINGGDVSKTIVHVQDHKVSKSGSDVELIDLLIPGVEATYQDIQINSIEITINNISAYGNVIDFPIGSSLSTVSVKITGNMHDAGTIDHVELQYNYMLDEQKNNILQAEVNNKVYQDTKTDKFEIVYNFNYTRVDNKSQVYYIFDGLQNIINYIKIHVTGTPDSKKKYYPNLESKGILIYSVSNMIPAHDIILDPIKINGVYPVFYNLNNMPIINNYTAKEINNYIINDTDPAGIVKVSKPNLNKTIIKDGVITLDLPKNTKYLFLAIPIKFKVYKVEYEDGINHFIHNWTGCLKMYETDVKKEYENMFTIDGRNIRFLKCNVYLIVMSKGIQCAGKIRIYVNDSTSEPQQIIFENTITDSFGNINISDQLHQIITYNENNISYIQNCEFNSTYWLTSSYDPENYDFYIDNYLKNFKDNGAN